jgi:hypothetical protein
MTGIVKKPGRPSGAFGECGRAFLAEAQRQPGTVRQIAERAQVGVPVALQLAKRFVQHGQLVPLHGEKQRPRVLAPPPQPGLGAAPQGNVFLILSLSAWRRELPHDNQPTEAAM